MISVVFDTNVFVSAALAGGTARQLMNLARSKRVKLFVSAEILLELAQKLRDKFLWNEEKINFTIESIGLLAGIIVAPRTKIKAVKVDPSDNKIVECAYEAMVDFIVTGDKDLLNLGHWRKIKIVSIREFLDKLTSS